MAKNKPPKISENYSENKTERLEVRLTPTAKNWLDTQAWAPAVYFERLARGVWKLKGPNANIVVDDPYEDEDEEE